MAHKISQTDSDDAQKFALDLSVNLTGTQLHNLAGVIAAARRDARQAALEEAAKVAAQGDWRDGTASKTERRIAQAIRNLAKDQPHD